MQKQHLVHSTHGFALVKKLAENGNRIFTRSQALALAPSVNLSPKYLNEALYYLAKDQWIIRLRKGLYTLSSIVPGTSPLHEFEIAMALVTPAAISHWSALHYHQLTEQIPHSVFIITTARTIPRMRGKTPSGNKLFQFNHVPYHFIQIKKKYFFGIETVWINEEKINMTDKERTFLDCLMMPRYCGGFSEVYFLFTKNLEKLNIDKLINYALQLDISTIKRLGWILEKLHIAPNQLQRLQEVPCKGYRLLDPTRPSKGSCNKKWNLQINFGEV